MDISSALWSAKNLTKLSKLWLDKDSLKLQTKPMKDLSIKFGLKHSLEYQHRLWARSRGKSVLPSGHPIIFDDTSATEIWFSSVDNMMSSNHSLRSTTRREYRSSYERRFVGHLSHVGYPSELNKFILSPCTTEFRW